MIKAKHTATDIDVFRGGKVVSSLLSTFSVNIRETRLTAMIGYLLSRIPEQIIKLFDLPSSVGQARTISIENNQKLKRTDIEIKTSNSTIIVEAKVSYSNPKKQAKNYKGKYKILLTNYHPKLSQRKFSSIKYFSWQSFSEKLEVISKHKNPVIKFLINDIINHLERHKMIKKKNNTEVFIRNLNEEYSTNLFLLGHLYACPFEKSERRYEALYFAPIFGGKITKLHPGVKKGVSYIAKIENVEIVQSTKELLTILKKHKGKVWLKKYQQLLFKSYPRKLLKNNKFSFFILAKPHLIFNPPISKQVLQGGKGRLSKLYYSFDDLFNAWKV